MKIFEIILVGIFAAFAGAYVAEHTTVACGNFFVSFCTVAIH